MKLDIPKAFVQTPVETKNDDKIIMKIQGELAIILSNLDNKTYQNYLNNENGAPILYISMNKALYEMLTSAVLFYKH